MGAVEKDARYFELSDGRPYVPIGLNMIAPPDDQGWSSKSIHLDTQGGPARNIADFFDGERSREQFKRKLGWYATRYGSQPSVFGWELWNEINVEGSGSAR